MKTIPLSQGFETLVDDEDFDRLMQFSWSYSGGYASRSIRVNGRSKKLYMHREILGITDSRRCDHKNLNGLDNQKHNLRPASRSQNAANVGRRSHNTSGFKGVRRHSEAKKFNLKRPWIASLRTQGKTRHLGFFDTPQDAARAYDKAAIETFGAFAATNVSLGLLTL